MLIWLVSTAVRPRPRSASGFSSSEGRVEGRLEGRLEGTEVALELKFGAAGLQLLPEVRQRWQRYAQKMARERARRPARRRGAH